MEIQSYIELPKEILLSVLLSGDCRLRLYLLLPSQYQIILWIVTSCLIDAQQRIYIQLFVLMMSGRLCWWLIDMFFNRFCLWNEFVDFRDLGSLVDIGNLLFGCLDLYLLYTAFTLPYWALGGTILFRSIWIIKLLVYWRLLFFLLLGCYCHDLCCRRFGYLKLCWGWLGNRDIAVQFQTWFTKPRIWCSLLWFLLGWGLRDRLLWCFESRVISTLILLFLFHQHSPWDDGFVFGYILGWLRLQLQVQSTSSFILQRLADWSWVIRLRFVEYRFLFICLLFRLVSTKSQHSFSERLLLFVLLQGLWNRLCYIRLRLNYISQGVEFGFEWLLNLWLLVRRWTRVISLFQHKHGLEAISFGLLCWRCSAIKGR